MLPLSRLGCPLSLKTPNMGNPGQRMDIEKFHWMEKGETTEREAKTWP